jgi:hypothetical protein
VVYDAGGTGEYNWQILGGSRFNSNKFMLKGGIVGSIHSPSSFIIKSEIGLTPKLFLSPQFSVYKKE